MSKQYFMPDKTFRKFIHFVAKDYLHVFVIRDCKDLIAEKYGYFDTIASHKYHDKYDELVRLFEDVGLDFEQAIGLVSSDQIEFEDYEKGLRKILKRYYPESMRQVVESQN